MKLKTNHSLILDILLSIVTFGIWSIVVQYKFLTEGKIVGKLEFNPVITLVLCCIPLTSFIGAILLLIQSCQCISARSELLKTHGQKPPTTAVRFVLSSIFGIFTLFIWPIIESFLNYKLWNKANQLYNETNI